jgi:phosphopantothenate---cysteine ligase (CTP)
MTPPPRYLVTAGNTREPIDRVRDWGNIFTGNTGRSIAEALAAAGGEVDLLTSNAQHIDELRRANSPIRTTSFRTHADLRALLEQRMIAADVPPYTAVFMTAAVADYMPERVFRVVDRTTQPDGREHWIVEDAQAGKVKSHFEEIAILGRRTEKLVDLFRTKWSFHGVLVKFKLEVGITENQLIEVAQASRRASDADYIVANTLDMVSGTDAGAWLLSQNVKERIARSDLANRLAKIANTAAITSTTHPTSSLRHQT